MGWLKRVLKANDHLLVSKLHINLKKIGSKLCFFVQKNMAYKIGNFYMRPKLSLKKIRPLNAVSLLGKKPNL